MASQLIQTKQDAAVASIQGLNNRAVISINSIVAQLDRVLNKTMGDNKTLLTEAEIISAAGGKLDAQADFIAALKAAVNIAQPGTYTTATSTETTSTTSASA